jgi:Rrf2 family iron-sulfur cluster assembly transcriptional regulator
LVFPRTLSGGLEYRSNALVFKTFEAEEDAVKLSTKGRYAVMAMVDLARHAQTKTRVSEIILAVDEPIKATRCTEMGQAGCRADRSKCLTHDLWEELGNQIHVFLSSVTLHDVLERKLSPRIAEAPPAPANSDSMAAAS